MNIKENVSLVNKNALGIESFAEFYAEIETEKDLEEAIRFSFEKKISLRVLGLGSNILLPTGVLKGLTIAITNKKKEENKDGTFVIGAGVILGSTVNELAENNYDLSPFIGYPSTIGGAVAGNSGTKNIGFGDYLINAVIYDANTGEKEEWGKKDFNFDYRYSLLKGNKSKIFWEGKFKFPMVDNVKEKMEKILEERINKQPREKSAGCFFKNPEGFSAGYLIDQCGLKGRKIGGAEISSIHANFFINTGGATSDDFLKLIEMAKTKVQNQFGLSLDLELEIWQ